MAESEMAVSEVEIPPSNGKLDEFLARLDTDVPSLEEYAELVETCGNPPIRKLVSEITQQRFLHGLILRVSEFLDSGGDASIFLRLISALEPEGKMAYLESFWANVDGENSCCILFVIDDAINVWRRAFFKFVFRPQVASDQAILNGIWNFAAHPEMQGRILPNSRLKELALFRNVSMRTIEDPDVQPITSEQLQPEHGDTIEVLLDWIKSAAAASCVFVQHPIEMQSGFVDMC